MSNLASSAKSNATDLDERQGASVHRGATISYKDIFELVDVSEATSARLLDIARRLHREWSAQLAWALGVCIALLALFLVWIELGAALSVSLKSFVSFAILLVLGFFATKLMFGMAQLRELRQAHFVESRVLAKLLTLIRDNKDSVSYYNEHPIERAMLEIKLERMSAAVRS